MANISQNHEGSGDNNVHIHVHDIPPEKFKISVEEIINLISSYQLDDAKKQLATLQKLQGLTNEAILLLNAVKTKIQQIEREDYHWSDTHDQLIKALTQAKNNWEKDILLSVILHLELRHLKEDAKLRVKTEFASFGPSTNKLYYAYYLDETELQSVFNNRRLNLHREELFGLFIGCIRCESFQLAKTIADKFCEKHQDSYQAQYCKLFVQVINLLYPTAQYWTATYSQKRNAELLADQLINLIIQSSGYDINLFLLASNFQNCFFTLVTPHKPLNDICFKYIERIEKYHIEGHLHEYVDYLKVINDKNKSEEKQKKFLEENAIDLSQSNKLKPAQVTVLIDTASEETITELLNKVEIDDEDLLTKDFCYLFLLSFSCLDSNEQKQKLQIAVKNLIETHQTVLYKLVQRKVLLLVERLIKKEQDKLVCELLSELLPRQDLWLSPLVEHYFNSLWNTGQFKTLNDRLLELNRTEWNHSAWHLNAALLERQHKFDEAIEAIKKTLDFKNDISDYWRVYLSLARKANFTENQLKEIILSVPESLLDEPSNFGAALLLSMIKQGNFELAESHLVRWFIENPENAAIPVMDVGLNMMASKIELKPSSVVGQCMKGVHYKKNGESITSLIVENPKSKNQYIINSNSPLGKLLITLNVGEREDLDPTTSIELVEVLPPYVASLRIASDIRVQRNDGSDPFWRFEVNEKNPERVIEILKKFSANREKLSEGLKSILANASTPTLIKCLCFKKENRVKSILELLRNDIKVDFGVLHRKNSQQKEKELLIDLYTACYIAITGLSHGMNTSLTKYYISAETKHEIELFLANFDSVKTTLFPVEINNELRFIDNERYKQWHQPIIDGFNAFLSHVQVLSPQLVDSEYAYFFEKVDPIFASTIYLAQSSGIKILCYDHATANILESMGVLCSDAAYILLNLSINTPIEKKLGGFYLSIPQKIVFPFLMRDLYDLIFSTDKDKQELANKIISTITNPNPSCIKQWYILLLEIFFIKSVSNKNQLFNSVICLLLHQNFYDAECCIEDRFSIVFYNFMNHLTVFINCTKEEKKQQIFSIAITLFFNYARGHFFDIEHIKKTIA